MTNIEIAQRQLQQALVNVQGAEESLFLAKKAQQDITGEILRMIVANPSAFFTDAPLVACKNYRNRQTGMVYMCYSINPSVNNGTGVIHASANLQRPLMVAGRKDWENATIDCTPGVDWRALWEETDEPITTTVRTAIPSPARVRGQLMVRVGKANKYAITVTGDRWAQKCRVYINYGLDPAVKAMIVTSITDLCRDNGWNVVPSDNGQQFHIN